MSAISALMVACAAFVGSHFLLSHPLRGPLVARMGEKGFLGLYSLVAFATFGAIIWAWLCVPASQPAYVPGPVAWGIASAAMWLASVLLIGSLRGNPALPAPGAVAAAAQTPRGVYAITRHPMLWAFAIWALVHMALWPTRENHVLSAAILLLAIGGAWAQDAKKRRSMGSGWRDWQGRTSFFPFAALLSGRLPWGAALPPLFALLGGTAFWLVMSWAHIPMGGRMPAGIFLWL